MPEQKHDATRPRSRQQEGPLQADPMLQEGRASRWRMWAVVLGIVLILGVVVYGVTRNSVPRVATFSPEAATPTGRGLDNAPLTQSGGAKPPLKDPTGSRQ